MYSIYGLGTAHKTLPFFSLPKNEPPNGPNYCARKHKFCKNRDNESNMMNLRLIRSESKF